MSKTISVDQISSTTKTRDCELPAAGETDNLTADLMIEYEDRDQFGTVYRATGEGDAFLVDQTRINGGEVISLVQRRTHSQQR